jgi:hypothetical protein
LTREPGDNLRLVSQENGQRLPRRVLRPSAFIVGFQGKWQHINIGRGGLIFNRQPIARTQPGN